MTSPGQSVLDWADARGIGFSHLVSLGDMVDVDFGDMLDYLANDAATRAMLKKDPGVDGILAMHCPTAVTSAEEAAKAVVDAAPGRWAPLLLTSCSAR